MALGMNSAAAEIIPLAVVHATVKVDQAISQKVMELELTDDSGKAFGDFTTRHVGQAVDLCVDEQPVMSPRIVEPILGGKIMVSGSFAEDELETMATRIEDKAAKVTVRTQDN